MRRTGRAGGMLCPRRCATPLHLRVRFVRRGADRERGLQDGISLVRLRFLLYMPDPQDFDYFFCMPITDPIGILFKSPVVAWIIFLKLIQWVSLRVIGQVTGHRKNRFFYLFSTGRRTFFDVFVGFLQSVVSTFVPGYNRALFSQVLHLPFSSHFLYLLLTIELAPVNLSFCFC